MVAFIARRKIRRGAALIALGMALTIPAHAESSAALAQDLAKVSAAGAEQRQALANSLDQGLRAGVNEQDLSKLVNQGAAKNYSAGDIALYVDKLASLQRAGLPVALVRDKMLEGMAKSTPAATILQVAANWTAALEDASDSLRGLEQRGLNYAAPSERAALINDGAILQQRHGVKQPLLALSSTSLESGRFKQSAASLHAAAELAELLLLRGAKAEQALALPAASLRANYSAQRIQELQQEVINQLRQGMPVADIASGSATISAGRDLLPGAFGGNQPGGFTGRPGSGGGPGFPGGAGPSGFPGTTGGPGPASGGGPGGPAAGAASPWSGSAGYPGGGGYPGGPGGFRR